MNIGFIANDSRKKLMQNFCIAYRGILCKHELFATGTTGRLIESVANLSIHKYLPEDLGGLQQMGAKIESNELDVLFFMIGSEDKPNTDSVLSNLVTLCDMHNIPLATNLATAEVMVRALDRGDLDWREMYK